MNQKHANYESSTSLQQVFKAVQRRRARLRKDIQVENSITELPGPEPAAPILGLHPLQVGEEGIELRPISPGRGNNEIFRQPLPTIIIPHLEDPISGPIIPNYKAPESRPSPAQSTLSTPQKPVDFERAERSRNAALGKLEGNRPYKDVDRNSMEPLVAIPERAWQRILYARYGRHPALMGLDSWRRGDVEEQ